MLAVKNIISILASWRLEGGKSCLHVLRFMDCPESRGEGRPHGLSGETRGPYLHEVLQKLFFSPELCRDILFPHRHPNVYKDVSCQLPLLDQAGELLHFLSPMTSLGKMALPKCQ